MKIYVWFVLLLTISGFGQIKNDEKSYIAVTGKAVLEVSPDEVYIDICLEEYMKDGEKVSLTILEQDLKTALAKVAIPEDELYISDINSVIAKTGWFTKEVLSTGRYSLKVTKVDKIKEVFQVFEKLNIMDARIAKATHSNLMTLQKETRIKAIKAAKEKADYLLGAIGAKTGKVLRVEEARSNNQIFATVNYVGSSNVRGYGLNSVAKLEKGRKKGVAQFENIEITSEINVLFKIE